MSRSRPELTVTALRGIPEVGAGDDLVALLLTAVRAAGTQLGEGDVLAISSKVVSKAAGLTADPHDKAAVVAARSDAVVAERLVAPAYGSAEARVTRVVRAKAGPVMAAAGVDASNTGGRDVLLVLPDDSDAVCRELRDSLCAATGVQALGIVLTDTAGRAWRVGQTDFALGAAGLRVLDDLRGGVDADGRPLQVTARAIADEIASAADLVKGKVRGIPAVLVRGLADVVTAEPTPGARSLVRSGPGDWFALGAQEAVRAALGVAPGSALAQAVGIRPVSADPIAAQMDRAVRVALATGLEAAIDVGADRIEVSGLDPVVVGLVAGRLSVALHGEGVQHRLVRHEQGVVVVPVPTDGDDRP